MKILVVEDEPKTGNYLKQGLTEAGFVVDLARDGTDGLHAAKTEDYDLIVLDIMLPGLDGREVLETVRLWPELKDVPFLVLSSVRSGPIIPSISFVTYTTKWGARKI